MRQGSKPLRTRGEEGAGSRPTVASARGAPEETEPALSRVDTQTKTRLHELARPVPCRLCSSIPAVQGWRVRRQLPASLSSTYSAAGLDCGHQSWTQRRAAPRSLNLEEPHRPVGRLQQLTAVSCGRVRQGSRPGRRLPIASVSHVTETSRLRFEQHRIRETRSRSQPLP